MAKNYCTVVPSKGADLFLALKKDYGYLLARRVFLKAINPAFIRDYLNKLSLNSEGVPTKDSLLSIPYIKNLIGETNQLISINKKFTTKEDTLSNFNELADQAKKFNDENPLFVAYIDKTDKGLKLVAVKRTEGALSIFNNQYSSFKLNQSLSRLFGNLGVTVGTLTEAEVNAGRAGVIDFNSARRLALGFSSAIRVANNMDGAMALSEEFSHLIIGVLRNHPLVSRALNALKDKAVLKKVLGEEFDDTVDFQEGDLDKVAEEALGQILRDNFLRETTINRLPSQSLFRRVINFIKSLFTGQSPVNVDNAIFEADSAMSEIAKGITSGAIEITESDIIGSDRDAMFNHLVERVDRNIEILKAAAKVEIKRGKIAGETNSSIDSRADIVLKEAEEDKDTVLGLLNYAKSALNLLKSLKMEYVTLSEKSPQVIFSTLRNTKMYIDSYAPFIKSLTAAYNDEEHLEDNMFNREFSSENPLVDEDSVTLGQIYTELNTLSQRLYDDYEKSLKKALAEFFKPFLGESIVVPFGKHKGEILTVEKLLDEATSDISFTDRWLDAMADSSDTLLQLMDAAVKAAKNRIRLRTIDFVKNIQKLMKKADSMDIREFSWMFEKDSDGNLSGDYISRVNKAQYEKEYLEMLDRLNQKYGENPTGESAINKSREKNQWIVEHADITPFGLTPKPSMYVNSTYTSLTSNLREILDEYLQLKSELEKLIPKGKRDLLKAILIRRQGSNRIIDSLMNPSKIWENLKEATADAFKDRADDDSEFGVTKSGLMDFSGKEFMTLPVLYTTRLENPNEISTDVFGALTAYAYSCITYDEMEQVVNPLELTKEYVASGARRISETRGGDLLTEKIETGANRVLNKITKGRGSYIEQKIEDFLKSQVYLRYLEDLGAFTVPLIKQKINSNKAASFLIRLASQAQLGFNWLANAANVGTGLAMQNIEAVAGEYFSASELAKADGYYTKEIGAKIGELNSRIKTNKLDLFGELFDVKQDFGTKTKRVQNSNLLRRIFGKNIAFIGQEAGDHWLYYRTAIAMALRTKVKVPGQSRPVSLWEALLVRDKFGDNSGIKEMFLPEGTTYEDGTPFDIGKFGRQVAHVNHGLFGIYNEDDMVAAERVIAGRAMLLYRKWIKPQFNKRFMAGLQNVTMGTYEEGYYRTLWHVCNELIRSKGLIGQVFDELTPHLRSNLLRALAEVIQFMGVWMLADLIEWPDDKDRYWHLKFLEYMAKREKHELGGLTPSHVMGQELLKTVSSPSPIIGAVNDLGRLVVSAMNPFDYVDEIDRGPYKGMSTVEKNLRKSPLPIVALWKQIEKFTGDLDTSINYYMRPSR